jgi:hypothetical protein
MLPAFTLSALAIVGAVGWAARSGSPWVTAAAVGLALALTALVLSQLVVLLPDRAPRQRHPHAGWVIPGIVAAALLIPLALPSFTSPPVRPGATPVGTVRGFLGNVVDSNGVGACRYLTRDTLACERGFAWPEFSTDAQIDKLHYTVSGSSSSPVVTVDGMRFRLQPATQAQRTEFQAPPTPWRIVA